MRQILSQVPYLRIRGMRAKGKDPVTQVKATCYCCQQQKSRGDGHKPSHKPPDKPFGGSLPKCSTQPTSPRTPQGSTWFCDCLHYKSLLISPSPPPQHPHSAIVLHSFQHSWSAYNGQYQASCWYWDKKKDGKGLGLSYSQDLMVLPLKQTITEGRI
jgi:hypothetical protein